MMSNGNGKNTIYNTVIALIIVGAIAYGGTFIVETKEALAINKREHEIFNDIATDLRIIRTDVEIIRHMMKERFSDE
jgi:hypothetical protein